MPHLFEDEKAFPDNRVRKNFVFLGYPFTPPLPQDDYRILTRELQEELPIRLWYFLDEVTATELMRKIWRAILRSDMAFFDISGGNPNVAFELGLAVAANKSCMTLLKTGSLNPLGGADLGYSERIEYSSRETLKGKLKTLLLGKSSAMRDLNRLSSERQSDIFPYSREEIEVRLRKAVVHVFKDKRTTRVSVARIFGDDRMAGIVLDGLRRYDIFKLEGQRRAARWLLSDSWVHRDHEVVGV